MLPQPLRSVVATRRVTTSISSSGLAAARDSVRRNSAHPPPRDFQFPQDENPTLAEPHWKPRLLDYIYVSFTNAIAFSPTDVMPLTRRVKMMMLAGSAVSATTLLLVAARAVNILR